MGAGPGLCHISVQANFRSFALMLKMYTPKPPAKLNILPGTCSFSLSLLACYHVCGPQVHIECPLAGFPTKSKCKMY